MKGKWTGGSVRLVAVGLPLVGLAVVAAVFGFRGQGGGSGSQQEEAAWLSPGPVRFIEARLSHPAADRYRPYHAAARGSGALASGPSLQALAQLEAKGDLRGLAAAYLGRGAPELAASYLQQAEDSPEVFNDRAVLALTDGDAAEAIAQLDKALQHAPRSAQALWNRGLALRELELWTLSAQAFEAVATLGEPGWADEARTRAQEMRERLRREQQDWNDAFQAGVALVLDKGTVSTEQLRERPDLYRLYLYDAIRAAPDGQRLKELWPVAETLDAHFGGSVLRDALRWAEARDFQRRGPLAELYRSYVFQSKTVPGGTPAYLGQLRAAGELDLLLGTLVFAREVDKDLDDYARLAARTRDPWFQLAAEHERAKVALARGELLEAEQLLLSAMRLCQDGKQLYRCGALQGTLGEVYRQLWRLPEASRSTRQALVWQRRAGFWGAEIDRMLSLGQLARLQGQAGLARALLDEALARVPGDCATRHFVRANDALALLEEMRISEARAAMREALECGGVQSLSGGMTLAELARLSPDPSQDGKLLEGLEALDRAGKLSPGRHAVALHIEGRFLIEQDSSRGEELLRRSIEEANRLPKASAEAKEARALTYASLLSLAGKAGQWPQALALFAEEAGDTLPARCLLAAAVDRERTLVVAYGPDGQLHGYYDESRRQPLSADARGVVPEALVAPLRACEQVSVLARPPLHGRARLLPDDLAWRYLVLPASRTPPPALPAQRLVVKDVEAPAALELPRLGAWEPVGTGIHVLSGADATPAHVLEAMTRATEIEIHAHGLINPTLSDASLIVLSPEQGGRYALTAAEVRAHRLEGAPLVTLAACRAAHTGLQVHEPFSLPAAFIEAGARTVLAATVDIPDAEAGPFFLAVQERIRSGQTAAAALRDVRMEWLRRDPESWARSVLVFE
ncbi:CHAT domain-containing protein [Hyalangium minutum]|uniref:CHAT domain-containing protein n=1 Tax=Hyalangium minutum TaxID=394096 RepID=UPI0004E7884A|nr:CHAT domain-containing protein [Hyalangium minutum]